MVITFQFVATAGSASANRKMEGATVLDALIIGHYGFQNLGDEAILAGMLSLLREIKPDGRWMVVSGDPPDTRKRHDVPAVDRTDIPAVLSAAYEAKVVIVGGGGLLSDQWGFRPQHALSREAGDIPGYLGPALAAAAAGRPVLVWGVGVGPFFDSRSKHWVQALAEVATAFTVRTEQDQAELASLGIEDSLVVGDPAWLVPYAELEPGLNQTLSDLPRPLVAVAPRSWGSTASQEQRERHLAEALDAFCQEHGGSVLFVPMQELEADDFDDRRCCERIRDQMSSANVHITPPGLSPGQLVTAIGRCELALNMRLHGTILGAMGKTPSVSISYDPKVTRMAAELGLEAWCHPDADTCSDRLLASLNAVWSNHPDLSYFMYVHWESMMARARRIAPQIRQSWSEKAGAAPATDYQSIHKEITLALTQNLAETQADNLDLRNRIIRSKENTLALTQNLAETRADNLDLRNRIIRYEEELRSVRAEARQKLEEAHDQHRYAERRGDLLQLELDNLRQTRAMQLVTRYWRVRQKLRRKVMDVAAKQEVGAPGDPAAPRAAIPDEVIKRIAESKGVVIFLLNIEWYIHLFQRPQQLAQAFARLGYTVVYDNSNQGKPGWEEIEPRLFLYNGPPEVLHELPDPLVWSLTYNWDRAAAYPEGTRTLYDWIDELDVFDGYDQGKLERLHDLALSDAALTSASARSLLERATERRADTLYLPNAVEFEHFANWEVSSPAHPALQGFLAEGRPIAGYYGAIARWMDYDLLTEVAADREDWSFLLIGPSYDQSTKNRPLFSLPNVEWVMAQPYQDLPRWLQSFDVAMIPFVVNEITVSTSPLKLFEYFAGGKPVVCSRMPEVVAFSEVHSYCDTEGMSEALDRALADSKDPEVRNSLRRRGEENSWLARAHTVTERLEQGG